MSDNQIKNTFIGTGVSAAVLCTARAYHASGAHYKDVEYLDKVRAETPLVNRNLKNATLAKTSDDYARGWTVVNTPNRVRMEQIQVEKGGIRITVQTSTYGIAYKPGEKINLKPADMKNALTHVFDKYKGDVERNAEVLKALRNNTTYKCRSFRLQYVARRISQGWPAAGIMALGALAGALWTTSKS